MKIGESKAIERFYTFAGHVYRSTEINYPLKGKAGMVSYKDGSNKNIGVDSENTYIFYAVHVTGQGDINDLVLPCVHWKFKDKQKDNYYIEAKSVDLPKLKKRIEDSNLHVEVIKLRDAY